MLTNYKIIYWIKITFRFWSLHYIGLVKCNLLSSILTTPMENITNVEFMIAIIHRLVKGLGFTLAMLINKHTYVHVCVCVQTLWYTITHTVVSINNKTQLNDLNCKTPLQHENKNKENSNNNNSNNFYGNGLK